LTLQKRPELRVIDEVSDGHQAVQKVQELQPDLIVLDIGLPTLNGIEVARRIRTHAPKSKILFLSENRSLDVAEEALRTGAGGYVVKSEAANELLPAIKAVLQDKKFVSAGLASQDFTDYPDPRSGYRPHRDHGVAFIPPRSVETAGHHEVGFYSDDHRFLDHLTQFIGAVLKAGNAAIVAATESHRDRLRSRLQAYGLDLGTAIERSRYIALDAADALSRFMVNGSPDPTLFMKAFGDLILTAANASQVKQPRVAIFGECVHLLCVEGNAEAAIQMEKLGNQLNKTYNVEILCAYRLGGVKSVMDEQIYQRISAEHSTVYSW